MTGWFGKNGKTKVFPSLMHKSKLINAPVAQWIEQRFPKPCAGGSTPFGRTILAVKPLYEG